jgi:ectoine hydroxylase-related dioxygenase (phytanoyl-CoA dioxygenase family)
VIDWQAMTASLYRDGGVLLPGLLSPVVIDLTLTALQPLIDAQTLPHATAGVQRDLIQVSASTSLEAIWAMGLWRDGVVRDGTLVNMKANCPRRPWHQDWGWWGSEYARQPAPVFIGVLLYLCDTTEENGSTQMLLGSHLQPERHHGFGDKEEHPEATTFNAKAGDALIFDARVCHGSHANTTPRDRPAMVIWHWLSEADLVKVHSEPRVLFPPTVAWDAR